MKKQTQILWILTISCLAACSSVGKAAPPMPTMSIGAEQGLPSSVIIYSDDFSNIQSGWQVSQDVRGSRTGYEHQGLRIVVNEAQVDFWSEAPVTYADGRFAVDASKLGGPDDNYFGLFCRMIDSQNYYAFLVSSDGYYGIAKVKESEYQLLNAASMDFSPLITRGRGTNRVRADCIGTSLALYVNGQLLVQVEDAEFTSGKLGLMAGSHDVIGVDILFDNFIVYQP
jgi:hypothetical protein